MTNHTKAPWQVRVSNIVSVGVLDGDEHWQFSGIIQCMGPREVAEANAHHIVKCVNYHDRLAGSIKELIKNGDVGMWSKDYQSAASEARALLSELSAHNGGEG